MSSRCVLDVSAAAAILFREPDSVRVAPLILDMDGVVVPQLFHLELANVARSKVRRQELDWPAARAMLEETSSWPVEVREVAWQRAWEESRRHDLTLYDAAYLHLAVELDLPLLTLDTELIGAAGGRSLLGAP